MLAEKLKPDSVHAITFSVPQGQSTATDHVKTGKTGEVLIFLPNVQTNSRLLIFRPIRAYGKR